MARRCTICASEHRDTIDARITTGDSSYALADAFGLSASAVQRHAKRHLGAALSRLAYAGSVRRGLHASRLGEEGPGG